MEVDEPLVDDPKRNDMELMVDAEKVIANPTQKMEIESSLTIITNDGENLVPNTEENIDLYSEKSVKIGTANLDKDNAPESQDIELIEEATENNKSEDGIADPNSHDEYMERDELIRSVLNEPRNRPTRNQHDWSSPETSEHSEFDISDDKNDFEIWSSDTSSPEISDYDPEVDETEEISTPILKPMKKVPPDYWKDIQPEKIQKFEFTGNPHIVDFNIKEKFTPLQCFKLFVSDEVINLLVNETNKYARSKFVKPGYHKDFLTGWIDVTPQEMREFIGLLIFMTLRRLPGTKYYWSGDILFSNPVAGRVMTETRFKRLLTFWYFGDDKEQDYSKIRSLLCVLNENFRKYKEPEIVMYVGKATLFLRDKYAFQRGLIGIPKRGQRLLRLLDGEIYTYKVVIMPPENADDRIGRTKELVLDLLQDYLNKGRVVVFHNLCLSLDLAQVLLRNKTHIVGPLRKKARNTPADLRKLKVKNNEVKGFQNSEGISTLKWRTWGQTCYGLSSCHGTETVQVEKQKKRDGKTVVIEQSKFLRDFGHSDKVFDLAEKFSVTESPLNNETKWYRRLANDLLTGTCVSNAFYLYKKINSEKIKFSKFQDELWRELVGYKCIAKASSEDSSDEET